MSEEQRPLKLVKEFSKANCHAQYGWQKMDDTTVLERKKLPILFYSNTDAERWGVIVTVYDFNSFQSITYVQHAYDNEAKTPSVFRTHFSEIENKQCVLDAHRALTELGGSPPPLEDVQGMLRLDKDMKVRGPLRLKGSEP